MKSTQNLLIVRLRSIGDMVLTTPVLEQIHKYYPDIRIHYLAEEGMGDVLSSNQHIANLVIVKKDIISQIKLFFWLIKTPFYMAINLHGGPRSVLLTLASFAKKRLGSKTGSPLCRFYTQIIQHPQEFTGIEKKYHSVERVMSAFEQAGFIVGKQNQWRQHLPIDNQLLAKSKTIVKELGVQTNFVVMHAVVRGQNEWGMDNKRQLCRLLYDKLGLEVLLLGASNDVDYLQQISQGCEYIKIIAGKTNLMQTAGIMSISVGFVGLDSGPAHMAAALNLPVAVLFGSTYSYLWRPWGKNVKVFEKKNDDNTNGSDSSCGLTDITVTEVFDWLSSNLLKES